MPGSKEKFFQDGRFYADGSLRQMDGGPDAEFASIVAGDICRSLPPHKRVCGPALLRCYEERSSVSKFHLFD